MKVKVLIIRFSSIGDIVLTSPAIRCLKQQLDGDVEIHFLTQHPHLTAVLNTELLEMFKTAVRWGC